MSPHLTSGHRVLPEKGREPPTTSGQTTEETPLNLKCFTSSKNELRQIQQMVRFLQAEHWVWTAHGVSACTAQFRGLSRSQWRQQWVGWVWCSSTLSHHCCITASTDEQSTQNSENDVLDSTEYNEALFSAKILCLYWRRRTAGPSECCTATRSLSPGKSIPSSRRVGKCLIQQS